MALEGAYSFDVDGTDYSGNGRHLTLGATAVSVAGGQNGNAFGKTGAAMPQFPAALLAACQSDDRCIMFWAKGALSTWWVRFQDNDINSGAWGVLNVSGSMAVQCRDGANNLLTRPTGTAPSATARHYCATYRRSTGQARLLVDGVQTGTQSFAAGTALSTAADWIDIGEWSTTGPAIDNLRFLSHVPEDSEIVRLANTAVTARRQTTFFAVA